ncbi:hypothetical protein M011DRAFT_461257 [Sporormia fimetaria CBS 119925]|uniref:RING-type domain-containing protein n=1 Tax=Sporormia fimetaria CBS 119925 TaxID=1340428 RepID=A0A6A6V3X4_9PLEO|nr:hypothetical protein M011DRAFT_461257 [Sporormia fimetaria CBS 119925]
MSCTSQSGSPSKICVLCSRPFSPDHRSVRTPCGHRFGFRCYHNSRNIYRGIAFPCPVCNKLLRLRNLQPGTRLDTVEGLWAALSVRKDLVRVHVFLEYLNRPPSATGPGDKIRKIQRALATIKTDEDPQNMFRIFPNVSASEAITMPIFLPLLRLDDLNCFVYQKLRIAGNPFLSQLVWDANACLDTVKSDAPVVRLACDHLEAAAQLENDNLFKLLHLFSVLLSQSVAWLGDWEEHPEEWANSAADRYLKELVGGFAAGDPTADFLDRAGGAHFRLWLHQRRDGMPALLAHTGEENEVLTVWTLEDSDPSQLQSVEEDAAEEENPIEQADSIKEDTTNDEGSAEEEKATKKSSVRERQSIYENEPAVREGSAKPEESIESVQRIRWHQGIETFDNTPGAVRRD